MKEIGRLQRVRRYPVKSMRGEDLERAFVAFSGLAGDRVYAFLDPAKKTNFPWVTAREVPEMLRFTPRFVNFPNADVRYPMAGAWRAEVETPEGKRCDIQAAGFLKELEKRWNRSLVLRFSEQGMHDAHPISVFAASTLHLLEREAGMPLDARRFRANFYVEWSADKPLYEEELLGKVLRIGQEAKILIAKKDPRCIIVNLDPETSEPSPQVLKAIGKNHRGCVGVYAVTVGEGVAAAGDPVFLLGEGD